MSIHIYSILQTVNWKPLLNLNPNDVNSYARLLAYLLACTHVFSVKIEQKPSINAICVRVCCYIRLVTNPMRHTLLSVNLIFNLSTVGISVVYKISSFAHTTNWMGKRKKKPIRSHFGDVHSSYVFHSPRIHFLWFSHQNISFVRLFVSFSEIFDKLYINWTCVWYLKINCIWM